MSRIAVVGPGAIGGTIAAWLSQCANHVVTLAVRTPFDRLDVSTPSGELFATPHLISSVAQGSPVDWVLVATKAYDSAAAAQWFDTLCDATTRVAVLQNGVEHLERFAPYCPVERIVPVMIDCPAERTAPGRIRQRGTIRMVVPQGENGARFVKLFADLPIDVSETTDFTTAIWSKLCVNSAGAVSAAILKPNGIVHHDGVAELMRGIVRECVSVGRAEGARLDPSIVDEVVANGRRAPRDAANSLYQDRLTGRPMEIDARNGVIVRLGRKHGIPTPLNSMVVALLEAAQQP
jgi:2-dehydropantoate 2-reductase